MLWAKIMALHAETVGILVEKAKFQPEVALGVAEAIEFAMTQAQFVTVPILDARLHGIYAELRVLEGKLDASIQVNKADMQRLGAERQADMQRLGAEREADMQRLGAERQADSQRLGAERQSDMQRLRAESQADMGRFSAEINAKLAEMEAKLVRWVFLVMLGNVALSLTGNIVLNALKAL